MIKMVALMVALNAGDAGVENAQQVWIGDGAPMESAACERRATDLNRAMTARGLELYFFCQEDK